MLIFSENSWIFQAVVAFLCVLSSSEMEVKSSSSICVWGDAIYWSFIWTPLRQYLEGKYPWITFINYVWAGVTYCAGRNQCALR